MFGVEGVGHGVFGGAVGDGCRTGDFEDRGVGVDSVCENDVAAKDEECACEGIGNAIWAG